MKATGWGLIVAAILAIGVCMGLSGCELDDFITVPVPQGVRQELSKPGAPMVPGTVSLTEARNLNREFELSLKAKWERDQLVHEQFLAEIAQGDRWSSWIGSLGTDMLDLAGTQAAAIPGLGAILPGALAGLGGLLLGRSTGVKKGEQVATQKEAAAWDESRRNTQQDMLMAAALGVTGTRGGPAGAVPTPPSPSGN